MLKKLCLCALMSSLLLLISCSDGSDSHQKKEYVWDAPPSDCMWVGPYSKDNEQLNHTYPDEGAAYWVSVYRIPEEGAYITFEGGFPYSRYMSLSTYRVAGLSLGDSLKDRAIRAKVSSVNPFVEGNPRNDPYRYYQITMAAGERPEDDAGRIAGHHMDHAEQQGNREEENE